MTDEHANETDQRISELTLNFAFFCGAHFENFLHDELLFVKIRIGIRVICGLLVRRLIVLVITKTATHENRSRSTQRSQSKRELTIVIR